MMYCNVIVTRPFDHVFTYRIKNNQKVKIGSVVSVPFGKKKDQLGMVYELINQPDKRETFVIKEIGYIFDKIVLNKNIIQFIKWVSDYTLAPIGLVVKLFVINDKIISHNYVTEDDNLFNPNPVKLNKDQTKAADTINKFISQSTAPIVLEGVTGSGKTEVYFDAIERAIKKKQQALIMLPEISLTPQLEERFHQRFGFLPDVWHSKISDKKRKSIWHHCYHGKPVIIIGARSSLFLPFQNLGLIIVDEEHDGSFKQQSSFRYSARDLSFMRAKLASIPLILGTATPSLETLKNVVDKKLTRLVLSSRPGQAIMPEVNLIDMRNQTAEALSMPLVAKMKHYLEDNKQVMLFINRRGYAPVFYCTDCDWKAECDRCDSALIYHRHINRLKCHHCGIEKMPEPTCPSCHQQTLRVLGYGTERLEENLESYFPDTTIIRIDRDTTRRKRAFEIHLEKINSGEPCIIVGTQMLAKGHDFSNLAFVGILDVDVGLLSLNFRATEHLAQLLIQVSGRAGRSDHKGEVSIQTHYPNHPIFDFIKSSHYTQYASTLLKEREKTQLPPYSHQALICANSKNKNNAEKFLNEVADLLKNIDIDSVEIWGPVSAVIEKKANYYYFNLYLQSINRNQLHRVIKTFYKHLETIKINSSVRWFLDVDPID